jgi:formylglycine-generating enzyme required for sulfatase activity
VAAAQKMAQDAEDERRRKQAILDQQAAEQRTMLAKMEQERRDKEAAEAKKKAEEKAKVDAARAAADFARRQFSQDKKVWYNGLGMKFVPVGRVHVCVFETRVADFDAFVKATRYDAGKGWSSPGFSQYASHPVVNVNWRDAQEFCKWLTTKEQGEKIIGNRRYRLLTDAEWSEAVGLRGESGATPTEKDGKVKGVFPWGNTWPPAVSAGNYPDSLSYDRFDKTAPAGSFKANAFGLHDLGGNAWEWCEDWSDGSQKTRVLRGGSYLMNLPAALFSSYRRHMAPDERSNDVGFRVVLSE